MTRKDYEALAGRVRVALSQCRPGTRDLELVTQMVNMLSEILEADNPRFKRDLFLEACGVPRPH